MSETASKDSPLPESAASTMSETLDSPAPESAADGNTSGRSGIGRGRSGTTLAEFALITEFATMTSDSPVNPTTTPAEVATMTSEFTIPVLHDTATPAEVATMTSLSTSHVRPATATPATSDLPDTATPAEAPAAE
jgi:hypothetical protein